MNNIYEGLTAHVTTDHIVKQVTSHKVNKLFTCAEQGKPSPSMSAQSPMAKTFPEGSPLTRRLPSVRIWPAGVLGKSMDSTNGLCVKR